MYIITLVAGLRPSLWKPKCLMQLTLLSAFSKIVEIWCVIKLVCLLFENFTPRYLYSLTNLISSPKRWKDTVGFLRLRVITLHLSILNLMPFLMLHLPQAVINIWSFSGVLVIKIISSAKHMFEMLSSPTSAPMPLDSSSNSKSFKKNLMLTWQTK